MCVCVRLVNVLRRPEDGSGCPGIGIRGGCGSFDVQTELRSSGKAVLLTTESFLQPPSFLLLIRALEIQCNVGRIGYFLK